MYDSSLNLKRMSITLALSSAMLCPAALHAAGNGNAAPMPQAVQQAGVVKGTIVDETGQPMIGVTVLPLGNTKNGTITDLDGNFTLANQSGKVKLEISYIGYKTMTALNQFQRCLTLTDTAFTGNQNTLTKHIH